LIFAATVFALYFWLEHRAQRRASSRPTSESRSGMLHIGTALELQSPIHNGMGKIRLGNRDWSVRGPNLPAGTKVRVTGVQDTTLMVDRCVD
jgi:hypothetical protein